MTHQILFYRAAAACLNYNQDDVQKDKLDKFENIKFLHAPIPTARSWLPPEKLQRITFSIATSNTIGTQVKSFKTNVNNNELRRN